MGYRLIHFNCARPLGAFSLENEFIRIFVSIMPRVFADAASFEGLHFHRHGRHFSISGGHGSPGCFDHGGLDVA